MKSRGLWIGAALACLVCGVYAQVAHFEFLNYDDPEYVANPHVRAGLSLAGITWAFTTTYAANWFPLTWTSHIADRSLFGANSGAQHLMNLALHVLAMLLLFAAMWRMTGAMWRSAFVAAVFGLHPLHIESVAWVAERKDVLSAVFFFATLLAYAWYVGKPSWTRYAVVAAAFCGALMSKPTTVTLPLVLLLLDYWPLRRKNPLLLVLEKIPLFILAIAASVMTFVAQKGGGAVVEQIPLGMRIENALVSYSIYILKFFLPSKLAVFYSYPASIPWREAAGAAAALCAITAWAIRRDYLLCGWLWFVTMLVPMIGIVQVGVQARADRYTYLPLTGLAIMLGWGFAEVFETRPVLMRGAFAVAVAAMAIATYVDLRPWQDSIALFRHAIEVTDRNYIAENNLGVAFRRAGRVHEAIPLFEAALRTKPTYAEAQNNLGEVLIMETRVDEAAPHIAEALRLNPNLASAHVNRGTLFSKRGRFEDAAQEYREALRIDPDHVDAHEGLGVVLTELGRYGEALPELLAAVEAQPENADAHYNLARLYGLSGRASEATAEFSETIRLDPGNAEAHFNLGNALVAGGRMTEGIEQFRAAVRVRPDYLNAHFNLASGLATEGRYDEAIAEFSEVLRLNPGFTDARRGLEACLELRGRK